jgi:hypothetical protein
MDGYGAADRFDWLRLSSLGECHSAPFSQRFDYVLIWMCKPHFHELDNHLTAETVSFCPPRDVSRSQHPLQILPILRSTFLFSALIWALLNPVTDFVGACVPPDAAAPPEALAVPNEFVPRAALLGGVAPRSARDCRGTAVWGLAGVV